MNSYLVDQWTEAVSRQNNISCLLSFRSCESNTSCSLVAQIQNLSRVLWLKLPVGQPKSLSTCRCLMLSKVFILLTQCGGRLTTSLHPTGGIKYHLEIHIITSYFLCVPNIFLVCTKSKTDLWLRVSVLLTLQLLKNEFEVMMWMSSMQHWAWGLHVPVLVNTEASDYLFDKVSKLFEEVILGLGNSVFFQDQKARDWNCSPFVLWNMLFFHREFP